LVPSAVPIAVFTTIMIAFITNTVSQPNIAVVSTIALLNPDLASPADVAMRLFVDGAVLVPSVGAEINILPGGAIVGSMSISRHLLGLAPGLHTVAVQWEYTGAGIAPTLTPGDTQHGTLILMLTS
jgi:hypothetical protein